MYNNLTKGGVPSRNKISVYVFSPLYKNIPNKNEIWNMI
jgi:hypothetical protein